MRGRIGICALALVPLLATSALAQEQGAPPNSAPPTELPSTAAPGTPPSRVRVGGTVMQARMIHMVQPKYPHSARAAHICGTVVLHAIIAKDGTIQQLQYISGPSELMRSAMDAVKQWRYEPTLLEGRAVEVETTISVIYTMDRCAQAESEPHIDSQVHAIGPPPPPVTAVPRTPIDPQLRADILHLFDVMHVKENIAGLGRTLFESMKPAIVASLPSTVNRELIAAAYLEKLLALLQSPDYMDEVVAAYAKYLSDDDIKALIGFYETPAGQHFIAASPQLMGQVARIGQQLAFGNMERVWKELCEAYPELQGSAKVCPKDAEKKKPFAGPKFAPAG